MSINAKLKEIQSDLKVPKNQVNTFGKYKYRNCEDILEAVKPLAAKLDAVIKLDDELVAIGDRYYVKSTATLLDEEGSITATAYAREATEKKGMDDAQITGAASSYARKYALNGLFAIDDTKDADSHDNRPTKPVAKEGPVLPVKTPSVARPATTVQTPAPKPTGTIDRSVVTTASNRVALLQKAISMIHDKAPRTISDADAKQVALGILMKDSLNEATVEDLQKLIDDIREIEQTGIEFLLPTQDEDTAE